MKVHVSHMSLFSDRGDCVADAYGVANTAHLAACWNACEGFEGELTPGLMEAMRKALVGMTAQAQRYTEQVAKMRELGTDIARDLDRIDYKFIKHTGSPYEARLGVVERWEKLAGADCEYKKKATN